MTTKTIPEMSDELRHRLYKIGWTVTETGCWEWNGTKHELGYGLLNMKALGLSKHRAHRLVFLLVTGQRLRPTDVLRHYECDNPPCVNPDHLRPGTQGDNINDMVAHRRHYTHGLTACKNGHDITAPNSTRIAISKRGKTENVCRQCAKDRANKWARRKARERKGLC